MSSTSTSVPMGPTHFCTRYLKKTNEELEVSDAIPAGSKLVFRFSDCELGGDHTWSLMTTTTTQDELARDIKRRKTEGALAEEAINYLRKKCLYIVDANKNDAFVGSTFMISNNIAITALHNFPLHYKKGKKKIIQTDLDKYKSAFEEVKCFRLLSNEANADKIIKSFTIKSIDVKLDICILELKCVTADVKDCFFISDHGPSLTQICLVVGYNLSISGQISDSRNPTFSTIACSVRAIEPGNKIFAYDGDAGKGLSGGCVVLKDLEVIGIHIGMVNETLKSKGEAIAQTCYGICAGAIKEVLVSAGVSEQIRD